MRSRSQALVAQAFGANVSARAAVGHSSSRLDGACPCMGCRQNLKKEKRLRNRVNAFRFKKNSAHPSRHPHTNRGIAQPRRPCRPLLVSGRTEPPARARCAAGFVRFARPGSYSPEEAKKQAEDAEFFSLVRRAPQRSHANRGPA